MVCTGYRLQEKLKCIVKSRGLKRINIWLYLWEDEYWCVSFSSPEFLWWNPLQVELTWERPPGCKQGQEWAAHEEAETFGTWGKGSSCFYLTAHLPLVQQKSQGLPWQEKTSQSNWRSQVRNNCSQLHCPKILHLFPLLNPLPLSLALSPYTYTGDFVWHSSVQKMLLGERFFQLHFWWKALWSGGWTLPLQKRTP